MSSRIKNIVTVSVMAALIFGLFIFCIVKPADAFSESERRELAQLPEVSAESVFSGRFMKNFESYALDQFPLRDGFRTLRALSGRYLFAQGDINGIYLCDGHISKLDYPLNADSVTHAAERFGYICEKYLDGTGSKVYLSVIPDKNYFLAEQSGHPSCDYGELVRLLRENTENMQYIDIFDLLDISDYYRTDTHWRQEKITDVAERLAGEMGVTLGGEYDTQTLGRPFYGVYYGQAALPLEPDQIVYLTNDLLSGCTVYSHESDSTGGIYDMERAAGKDPYELFLSGPRSLLVLENPAAQTQRELIVFRDSFASSLVPLLAEGYSKITLVDIRYISPMVLGNFIDFHGQDVLFLYSTLVLNNSETIK